MNLLRGEAVLGPLKLKVDFNGFCTLERITGLKVPQLLGRMADGLGFDEMRSWLYAFAQNEMTDTEIGDMLNGMVGEQGYEAAMRAVGETLGAAVEGFFAPPAKVPKANPPKAA